MTIELIDFMRNHSIEFVQQREMQSMKKVANLYKNLYMTAPDTFLSCVCDSDDVLVRPSDTKVESAYLFLQSFKIVQYNNTAIDTLSCASSLSINPDNYYNHSDHEVTLGDVIINPYKESDEVMRTAALGGNLLSVSDLQNSAVLKLGEVLQDVIQSPFDQTSKQTPTHERILPLFVKGKNQTILTCSLSISKILLYDIDSAGEGMVFFNIILHDITQKYKLLDEINVEKEKAIEANKAKSQFLAQMSHELRTPLHGIIGLTDVLLSKCKEETENEKNLDTFDKAVNLNNICKDSATIAFVESEKSHSPVLEQQTNIIQTIRYSGNILLGLINDLLDICKIESSKIKLENKKFNLRRAIDQIHCGMFQLQAREKSLEFNLQLGENVPTFIVGDEYRLVQILINLVYNAIKFTDMGSVSLIIESKPPSEDNVYELTFKVTDTGIGISQHDLKRLFQPFSQILSTSHKQTKINEGTGLGLYICKQLVEMMRGTLCVDSEEGVGSTFWFTIKFHGEFIPGFEETTRSKILSKNVSSKSLLSLENCKKNELTTVRTPTIEDFESSLPKLKILIVEDNAINRIVLINMLKKIGCTNIAVAQDGLEGVQQFEEFKKTNQLFDIIFVDIFMPRLDGYGTVRRILELESNDPSDHHSILVALTANGFEETRNYCLEHGFDVFMSKPFSITDLEQCVTNCMTRIHPSSIIP
ncbi:histidine kinase-like ATPase protein [Naegleria gruberi]|uniref:histidine kinase n=1 Tax=Naegleria gruberi TaxID=5762 RepID=D2V1N0_NAEGR|nr:histidine kinase-like ATPase protein [Naegleria gruberi]EFC49189.1 histidine kinase-like ATPase protein [Naegleria gruberi]|eukprot:XP_002681933.1 histidine kinase-like ATPase protein [Naegleria gruberi strain NEG-M]